MNQVEEAMETDTKRGRGRPAKYPWGTWMDGEERKLEHGKDFAVKPESFRQAALMAARTRGVKVSTSIVSGAVTLKATKEVTA